MQKNVTSRFGKLAFVALFGAMVMVAAFKAIPKPGTNLLQGVLSPLPTLKIGNPLDSTNAEPTDEARFSAIEWTTNGVDLVLHRPPALAVDALAVTLVGSTNLVTATWEPYTNVTFAAGETNLAVFADRAMLDAHAVSNMCFFAFINSGDSDNDGIDDWHERFNLKTDPHSADTDLDGMPDGWEHESGLLPSSAEDDDGASGDPDDDGLSNWEEYILGTLPLDRYSFGDGIEDQDWVAWGFDMPLSDIHTVKTQIDESCVCVPFGFAYRTPFSLTEDSDQIADWTIEGFVNYPVCYKGGITPRMQAKFSVIPSCTITAQFFAGQIASPSPVGGVFEENVQFVNGESGWVSFTGVYGTWDGAARYFYESTWQGLETLQLTKCVERLNGGHGNGEGVNCTDCALFVMAFSNLLGCSLYSSQMQGDFDTNHFIAIGYTDWAWPVQSDEWHFIYHEVAWDGNCEDCDLVYDACLRYDGDDDPANAPHVAELPAGVVFSDGSPFAPLVYRERLASPGSSGYGNCRSRPATKRRMDELK